MAMYQDIDDTDGIENPDTETPKARSAAIWLSALAGLLLICAVLYFGLRNPPNDPAPTLAAQQAERTSYHAAISERDPAMRRARLTDFLSTYPKSERTDSVRALLGVISVAESADWAAVTETIFDPDQTREDKLAALDAYEIEWGASLLGGRAPEITSLREELSAEIKKYPSRKMKEEKSSVPEDIEDEVMVGGPMEIELDPDISLAELDLDDDDTIDVAKRKVVGPKLKRPSNPKYPRQAYRRKVSALVTVSLDIDNKGRVEDVEVISVDAEAYQQDFARASRRAARKSRYSPKTVNGRAVPTRGHVKRYRFTAD